VFRNNVSRELFFEQAIFWEMHPVLEQQLKKSASKEGLQQE
jgi:hypothetical protein